MAVVHSHRVQRGNWARRVGRICFVGIVAVVAVFAATSRSFDAYVWGGRGVGHGVVASTAYDQPNVIVPANLTQAETAACTIYPLDNSAPCVQAALSEVNYARGAQGLGPMVLGASWAELSVPEQVLIVVNAERTARGLATYAGLNTELDHLAQMGITRNGDPPLPSGAWGSSIWAGGYDNVLLADYAWMYSDGPGGQNVECTNADSSGCFGHRAAILMPCASCLVGVGAGSSGGGSLAAVFVGGWSGNTYYTNRG
jgi:hypothetical protein